MPTNGKTNPGVERAIRAAGSQQKLASRLSVVQSAVSKWLNGQVEIPAERAVEVHRAFPSVQLSDLRSDLWSSEHGLSRPQKARRVVSISRDKRSQ
jgi:DNA-binding transcriptional regulator YdaS (Cro superfamily)